MRQSDDILVCRVPHRWYSIVKNEYISAGSAATNFWTVKQGEAPDELAGLKPGSLVLNVVDEGDHFYIVGGGYFLNWGELKPVEAWERFGVRNGYSSFDDLKEEIAKQGGNADSTLISTILFGTFIFSRHEVLMVPDEFKAEFSGGKSRFMLSVNEPLGRYLERMLRDRRAGLNSDEYSSDWRGIYYLAARHVEHSDIDGFYAAVLAAYNFKCAVTGSEVQPLLDVANIQPCYSNTFQSVQNGILMRTDLHRLFSEGYITLRYTQDLSAIEVMVSKTIKTVGGADYLQYDGRRLTLPADKTKWPKREYLEWHQHKCFEHWLHVGGTPA